MTRADAAADDAAGAASSAVSPSAARGPAGPLRVPGPAAGVRVDASHARGVQIGDGGVQTNVFVTAAPAVRSAYAHQVRAIAPPALLDRRPELAELAAFCTGPGDGGYLWWRAPAWAGKSALMAWFALQPPPGVRVVSFFVTGRFAGHGDRTGFTDVVLEQLADLLDRPLPAHLSEATRGPHLSALLADAAALCRDRGERLVLLVDGLDEDRGAVPGPDVHSVAALLPVRPPHGLRIVVAGRPDPPLPDDVPDDHPLRTEGVVRDLGMSPHAQVVRRDAERELKRLLHGGPAERDLLGLVTASGGGLRAADLAELTGLDRWRVDEQLGAVTARTFTRGGGPVRGAADEDGAPDAYLLAHEELQAAACRFLGPRLDGYRERLGAWADAYRARGWPPDTPDYLLRGYPAMLADAGRGAELLSCATDRARHGRLLARTGGDAAALAEIGAAQDAVLAREEPDLRELGVLAIHHGLLSARNTALPSALPAVWAVLGDVARARALAGSAPEAGARAELLTDLVERALHAGHEGYAVRLAERVEATLRGVENAWLRENALVRLAAALAGAGLTERATALAGSLTGKGQSSAALRRMAEALARSGRDPLLRELIEAHPRPEERGDAWRQVVEVWAGQGRLAETERLALSLTTRARTLALESLADAQARAGRYEEAEATARAAGDGFVAQRILKTLAVHLAGAGFHDRAEALVEGLTEPMLRLYGLHRLASIAADAAAAASGTSGAKAGRADALDAVEAPEGPEATDAADVMDAVDVTRAGDATEATDVALAPGTAHAVDAPPAPGPAHATEAAARHRARAARLWARACALADAVPDARNRARTWTDLLRDAARAAGPAELRRLADRTEALARTVPGRYGTTPALDHLAVALTREGAHEHAEAVLATMSGHGAESTARKMVDAAVRRGDHARAEALVRAEEDPRLRDLRLHTLVDALRRQGLRDRATAAARTLRSARLRAERLAELALAAAEAGEREAAAELAVEAERDARSVLDGEVAGRSLAALLRALAAAPAGARDLARIRLLAGRTDAVAARLAEERPRGERLAELVAALYRAGEHTAVAPALRPARPGTRATALTALVHEAGEAGRSAQVEEFAEAALDAARSERGEPETVPHLVRRIAAALGRAGAPGRAERLLATVAHPQAQVRGWAELVASTPPGDRARLVRLADRAEAAVLGVPASNDLDEALLQLAEALVGAGLGERAEAVARPLLHPYANDVPTTVRIRAAAARRDGAEVDRLAGTMRSPRGVLRTMTSLAVAAAGDGDPERAREFLRVATAAGVGPEDWDGLVGPVVAALAAAGETATAESLAAGVPLPGAATRIGAALARDLGPARARPLLARALREGDWRDTAEALGGRWPDAVAAMTDAYLDGTS
ncbi:hypothetical protein [Streptomyces showdoensis]|uniref:Uncharacterized protein n=1 Tax=Streptomyces showdoensis TaxID=68268 RepID=A0A2P2GH18_STREW|nr:hypothetical protein [Streptomyces showdoensis]KKZ70816.1 hypothetical protein VO63_27080 [Streptomyces showdoensis]